MDIDPGKIKALLNVEQYPEALAKLYRIISKDFSYNWVHVNRYFGIDAFEIHGI